MTLGGINNMDYDAIFRLMGEDTEDIARNYGSMQVPETSNLAKQPSSVTQNHGLPQMSDAAYARATMEGPF